MIAVDFLHHENPSTWAGVKPATFCTESQRQTDHATQPTSTRGLLVTDHVILNHGQVTWTAPELAPYPNYTTTPTGGCLSSRKVYRASLPYLAGLEWYWARTRDKVSHDPIP
ncbi:hypothetical protein TNCV_4231261 [Trichonephila clavipes]|uniref:Uncharacterized protein n=1 Tax=Trichonephila clavipes TaxID=2585209 RepID=A0A8X6SD12_TRICX|nr:hypothetical protein TNCV_4231261 [Trichonephila clavipes]